MDAIANKNEYNKSEKNNDTFSVKSKTDGTECEQLNNILIENDTLKGTTMKLKRVIKQMEEERGKLKNEIANLNDDVINSLVAERDEISERNFLLKQKLEESDKTVKEMKKERIKLETEISNLHDDVINSLVAERDEISESRFSYKKKLEKSEKMIDYWKKNAISCKTKFRQSVVIEIVIK